MGEGTGVAAKSFPGRLPFLLANFLTGDIQTGIMPLMSIDLLLVEHWRSSRTGIVLAFGSLVLLLVQPLAGALADRIASKRTLFFLLNLFFAAGCLLLYGHPSFERALLSQLFLGIAQGGVIPVLGSVAMGLVGSAGFPRVTGLAQGAGHAGSVFGALSVLWLANQGSFFVIFLYYALTALLASLVLFFVPGKDIDPLRAREAGRDRMILPVTRLLTRSVFLFFLILLFFFVANTAMLPLAGDKLSGIDTAESPARVMAVLVLFTQAVMIPFSLMAPILVRKFANEAIFLGLCLLVLSLRGGILAFSRAFGGILGGQCLDGAVMGIMSVLLPVMVAGLAKNTGRFNLLQGVTGAVVSAGAMLSQLLSGHLLDDLGIDQTLQILGSIALLGAALSFLCTYTGLFSSSRSDVFEADRSEEERNRGDG